MNKENEIKVNLENLNEEERQQLMAIIEKANKPKSKRWMPDKDKLYYTVNSCMEVNYCASHYQNTLEKHYSYGNVFETREEAEAFAKKLRVLAKMRVFALEHNSREIDWGNSNQVKYCLRLDLTYKKFLIDCYYSVFTPNVVFFTSEEIAQQCINELGDEIKEAFGMR